MVENVKETLTSCWSIKFALPSACHSLTRFQVITEHPRASSDSVLIRLPFFFLFARLLREYCVLHTSLQKWSLTDNEPQNALWLLCGFHKQQLFHRSHLLNPAMSPIDLEGSCCSKIQFSLLIPGVLLLHLTR